MSPNPDARRHEQALRDFALSFPEAHEEFPWGERVVKVRGKIFVFLGASGEALSVTTKLPRSHVAALDLGFTEPTGYGLGKSGWITARFGPEETPPLETLRAWIEESYAAVAPKKLAAARQAMAGVPGPVRDLAPPVRRGTKKSSGKPAKTVHEANRTGPRVSSNKKSKSAAAPRHRRARPKARSDGKSAEKSATRSRSSR